MTIILKALIASALINTAAESAEPHYSGNFTADNPAIYDLGPDSAIVFAYLNHNDRRVVVTTIAPKDPDSGRVASEHIVTLEPQQEYAFTLASSVQGTERIDVEIPPVAGVPNLAKMD